MASEEVGSQDKEVESQEESWPLEVQVVFLGKMFRVACSHTVDQSNNTGLGEGCLPPRQLLGLVGACVAPTSKVPKDQGMWSGGRHKEGHTYASTQGNSKRAIGHPYIEIKRNY